jgi:glycosyltransferase involved in cell wall biosynthesis
VLARERFDLVHAAGVDAALLAAAALGIAPVVWDLCDCASRYYDRQAGAERHLGRALWYRLQAAAYRRLERRLLRRDLAVIVASPSEAEALPRVAGQRRSRVHVLPTGVAAAPATGVAGAPPAARGDGPARLVFTGTLGYAPNVDAVLHFCRDIFPRIRRERPDARFDVLGDGASPELVAVCRAVPGVFLLGFVSDVFAALRQATVFVCPMRQGTGIKVKLLEAMACGLPIVASPIAVEGVPEVVDGSHLHVAASAEDFARRVLDLLGDARQRQALGDRARELAGRYAWARLGERLDLLCREEVERRREPRR